MEIEFDSNAVTTTLQVIAEKKANVSNNQTLTTADVTMNNTFILNQLDENDDLFATGQSQPDP